MKRKPLPLSDDDTVNEKSDAQEQAENKKSARDIWAGITQIAALALFGISLALGGAGFVCITQNNEHGATLVVTALAIAVSAAVCASAAIVLGRSSADNKIASLFFLSTPFLIFILIASLFVFSAGFGLYIWLYIAAAVFI